MDEVSESEINEIKSFESEETSYNNIIKLFANKNLSLYKIKKILEEFTGLVLTFYDICENFCIYYIDTYENYQSCPLCESSRYDSNNKSKRSCLIFLLKRD